MDGAVYDLTTFSAPKRYGKPFLNLYVSLGLEDAQATRKITTPKSKRAVCVEDIEDV